MKKIKFFVMAIVTVMVVSSFVSCTENTKSEEGLLKPKNVLDSPDDEDSFYYSRDSLVFAENKNFKGKFQEKKAKIFFVQKWNTPDFFSSNEEWTGIAWDGNAFLGYDAGDGYVYFTEEYCAYSDKYKKETGDSLVKIEKKFPKDGVTDDPRKTCWWLSSISNPSSKNIDSFLITATNIKSTDQIFKNYIKDLKKKVLKCQGGDTWEQIIVYTMEVVPGKPNTWDAWKWPGYYGK